MLDAYFRQSKDCWLRLLMNLVMNRHVSRAIRGWYQRGQALQNVELVLRARIPTFMHLRVHRAQVLQLPRTCPALSRSLLAFIAACVHATIEG
jgi:hypothetical protein